MNKLRSLVNPIEKLKAIYLSNNSPCKLCSNLEENLIPGGDIEIRPIDAAKCINCLEYGVYTKDCLVKLRWYEDNDETLKNYEDIIGISQEI